jgi:hypothetical protein
MVEKPPTDDVVTVKVAPLLVTPPFAAVIVLLPALTPLARPELLLIVATPVELLAHVSVGQTVVLSDQRHDALYCCVPLVVIEADDGETVMLVSVGLPPLNVAVTVALPVSENGPQLPVPEQVPPLHPVKVAPLLGVSVQVIDVPER